MMPCASGSSRATRPTASKGVRHEPKPIEVWSAEEVARFLRTTAGAGTSYHTMLYVAITSGCRSGELRRSPLGRPPRRPPDWRSHRRSGGQRGRRREGAQDGRRPAHPRAPLLTRSRGIDRWRARLEAHGIDSQLLLPGQRGTMVSRSNLKRSVRYWAGKAGGPALKPHGLTAHVREHGNCARHDGARLARHLGHTDPSFTMRRYVHFFERHQPRKAMTLGDLTGLQAPSSEVVGGTQGGTEPQGQLTSPPAQEESPVQDRAFFGGGRYRI